MNALILGIVVAVGSLGSVAPPRAGGDQPSPDRFTLPEMVKLARVEQPRWRGPAPEFGSIQGPARRLRPPVRPNPKVESAAFGAAVGLFAGAALGYVITNSDDCDTCALRGIAIGAPAGAAIGAVIGFKSR